MTRYYLDPDILGTIPIEGLTAEQVGEAISNRCNEERIAVAAEQAAAILREAGVDVDAESIQRLRKLAE